MHRCQCMTYHTVKSFMQSSRLANACTLNIQPVSHTKQCWLNDASPPAANTVLHNKQHTHAYVTGIHTHTLLQHVAS